jgi:hypothetical protein
MGYCNLLVSLECVTAVCVTMYLQFYVRSTTS